MTACSKADNSARDHDLYLYQLCLFMIVNNLFHEMGHVFGTWLSGGQADTPPQINALAPGPLEDLGEAGRALENYTLGGQILFYRDPKWEEGDRVCSRLLLWSKASLLAFKLMYLLVRPSLSKKTERSRLSNPAASHQGRRQLQSVPFQMAFSYARLYHY